MSMTSYAAEHGKWVSERDKSLGGVYDLARADWELLPDRMVILIRDHPLSTYALRGRGGIKEMTNFCVR